MYGSPLRIYKGPVHLTVLQKPWRQQTRDTLKHQLVPVHTTNASRERSGIAPLTGHRTPKREHWYPQNWRLGEQQTRPGRSGEF